MELLLEEKPSQTKKPKQLTLVEIRGLLSTFGELGEAVWQTGREKPLKEQRAFFEGALIQLASAVENTFIHEGEYSIYKDNMPPVSFTEFVTGKQYLDRGHEVWPEVLMHGEELNSGKYVEAVLTGGIGSAKTSLANYTIAYQVYVLSRYKNPHAEFGLATTDEIVFGIQSFSAGGPTKNAFERLYNLITSAPYFQNEFQYSKEYTSELIFPNRICCRTYSGSLTAAIGQNLIGGLLDEVNYMQIVENSKQNMDSEVFDQAQALYNMIRERRASRFLKAGKLAGMLCLASSKRYPGEFTDRKLEEAERGVKETGATTIYVYDKRVWEVKPAKFFTGEWFRVFLGDSLRKPRLLKPGELVPMTDEKHVLSVPKEFEGSFRSDILKAIRDIGGHSTYALNPFIIDPEPVEKCFGRTKSILSREECDYVTTLVSTHPKKFHNLANPRWIHLDLALTGDAAGVACGYINRFIPVKRSATTVEMLPEIVYDFILRVVRPENSEIIFARIRDMIIKLRALGLPIKFVSMDTFQSADTRQILASQGFMTGIRSVDESTLPYDVLKTAMQDQRVLAPEHDVAMHEVVHLERNMMTNKIDHPPHGSKDCADAMAGVAYGLTMRTELWHQHGVPPMTFSDMPGMKKG